MKLHEIWWQLKVAFDLLAALFEFHASYRTTQCAKMVEFSSPFVENYFKHLSNMIFRWHFRFIWLVGNSYEHTNSWSLPLFLVCVFSLYIAFIHTNQQVPCGKEK